MNETFVRDLCGATHGFRFVPMYFLAMPFTALQPYSHAMSVLSPASHLGSQAHLYLFKVPSITHASVDSVGVRDFPVMAHGDTWFSELAYQVASHCTFTSLLR